MGNLGNTDNIDVIAALKKAEKMRIEFVANVSHELRTPLTSIKGYAETLLQDMEEGRAADPEFLKIILKNSNRLLALINDLLDLSAIESGADELHPATLDLHEITQHALHALQLNAENKHSTILTEILTPNVYADPKRVEQVITNLVDNAIKYCPTGSTVTVRWALEHDELGEAVFLRVIDNGPGIAEKYLDRLFERFYRLDKGRSRESGGTGLGLSIVKHVMQRHDGSVTVESTLGTGTTFICRFPHESA
jgi:two-component system phosphate regulon sensor histidine kinase PhoR